MNERITKQIEEMKKQTIGVEVEMNNIRRDKAAELAAAFFGTGRFENTASRNGYYTWSAWDASGTAFSFTTDLAVLSFSAMLLSNTTFSFFNFRSLKYRPATLPFFP